MDIFCLGLAQCLEYVVLSFDKHGKFSNLFLSSFQSYPLSSFMRLQWHKCWIWCYSPTYLCSSLSFSFFLKVHFLPLFRFCNFYFSILKFTDSFHCPLHSLIEPTHWILKFWLLYFPVLNYSFAGSWYFYFYFFV